MEYFESAILIRRVEEKLLDLYMKGAVNGTLHTCIGQELNAVVPISFLNKNDKVVSNHRGHGHFIAKTGNVVGLIGELMGRDCGVVGGIGGSQHLYSGDFISNGIQGGMTPVALGMAMANKFSGNRNVVLCYIGDGTLGEGILWESLNLASVWSGPVVYVLENNHYAQSTSIQQTFGGSLRQRIEGFGIVFFESSSWDVSDLEVKSRMALENTRENSVPSFLMIDTYRLHAHSKGDDNRQDRELQLFKTKDLINQFMNEEPKKYSDLKQSIDSRIEEAVAIASRSEEMVHLENLNHAYSEPSNTVPLAEEDASLRYNTLIYQALRNILTEDAKALIIGEDVEFKNTFTPKAYGGAFKVTNDLSDLFPGRVRNTPISEGSIVGVGIGLALSGYHPIVEIMFGDFLSLTFDQLFQHATKFKRMFNKKIDVPLIIRTPMGGRRGYGPTHSQSIEKFFLGMPDLNIVALNHRLNPIHVYQSIIGNANNPYLILENKVLYTRYLNTKSIVGFDVLLTKERFPSVILRPTSKKSDVTIFCYGGMLEEVEEAIQIAFDEEEIKCEVICPSLVYPINIWPVVESVGATRKILFVEEGINFAALSSEVVTQLHHHGVNGFKLGRLSNNNIVPCSYKAENSLLPNKQSIYAEILRLCGESHD